MHLKKYNYVYINLKLFTFNKNNLLINCHKIKLYNKVSYNIILLLLNKIEVNVKCYQ